MENLKWCDLPSDILAMIAKRLCADHIINIGRLQAVCSSWYSSLPYPNYSPFSCLGQVPFPFQHIDGLPIIAPFKTNEFNSELAFFRFSLSQRIVLLLSPLEGSSKTPWIIKVEETGPNKWLLINPCTFGTYYTLDPAELVNPINLLNYRVIEINRSYELYAPDEEYLGFGLMDPYFEPLDTDLKVTVQSDDGIVDDDQIICHLTFLALRESTGCLALWKFGSNEWTPVNSMDHHLCDIVCYRGEFHAVDDMGRLFKINLVKSILVEIVADPFPFEMIPDFIYLVLFDGCLFLLTSKFISSSEFPVLQVYVLNGEEEFGNPRTTCTLECF